jgi:hypothetical protein
MDPWAIYLAVDCRSSVPSSSEVASGLSSLTFLGNTFRNGSVRHRSPLVAQPAHMGMTKQVCCMHARPSRIPMHRAGSGGLGTRACV